MQLQALNDNSLAVVRAMRRFRNEAEQEQVERVLASYECGATIRMRGRIASPENVPERSTRCLTTSAPIASALVGSGSNFPFLCHMLGCCGGTCGVVGDAYASSKAQRQIHRALLARCAALENCAPLPARSGSTSVVPNTIWCATSRRQSFIRRWSVLNCPSG